MNGEGLLDHYERIADAPDAIPRLRQFILDLAVRGKLVPQDPNGEPASELLKRIADEKARLVKAGKVKKENPLDLIDDATKPYDLPDAWEWVRLDVLTQLITKGSSPKWQGVNYVSADEGILFITSENVGNYELRKLDDLKYVESRFRDIEPRSMLKTGDILMNLVGASIGRTALYNLKAEANINQAVALVRLIKMHEGPYVDYLLHYFNSRSAIEFMLGSRVTTAQPNMSLTDAREFPVPLPPVAEQHRIVAKVDELMSLCDRLEAARAEREAVRDRLEAASLACLNAPDPDTFRDDARFAVDTLQALTTRPDQIKQLRQTILNLAVRGRLVPQDPNDEAASELLKRIAAEKMRLVKEGKSKRQEPLPEPDLDQAPFELPSGWTWGCFPELGTFGRGKSKHRPRNDPALFDSGTHLMIQTGDVARSHGVIETFTNKYNDLGLSQSFKWPKGTLCITIAANIADSGILSFDACFPDSVVGFVPASIFENARYFEYFVRTAKANLLEFAPATAQKNINLEILTSVLIPLPPLAEQHRIVAKVDALMDLCDRLEASLDAAATTRRRLLDGILADALAPAIRRDAA